MFSFLFDLIKSASLRNVDKFSCYNEIRFENVLLSCDKFVVCDWMKYKIKRKKEGMKERKKESEKEMLRWRCFLRRTRLVHQSSMVSDVGAFFKSLRTTCYLYRVFTRATITLVSRTACC